MTRIVIDTSLLIGLLDPKDIWHQQSLSVKQTLQDRNADIAVLDCVLSEAVSTLARRIHEQRRTADLSQLVSRILVEYPTEDIMWVLPDVPVLYTEIIELVRSSSGELNFHDALIALSCRYREIPYIASFDRDFDRVSWLRRVSHPDDLS